MKKTFLKLKELWLSETPKLARFLQLLSASLAAIPLYFSSLPEEFKSAIPENYIKYIAIAGGVLVVLCNFFKTKEGERK